MTLLNLFDFGASLGLVDAVRSGLELAQDVFVFAALPTLTVVFGMFALDSA